jgi:hypothetical protein
MASSAKGFILPEIALTRPDPSSSTSNSHFGPSGCHIVMAGLVPAIHRGTVLRGWPELIPGTRVRGRP